MFKTIVVGCDGSDRGRGAVALAHVIAAATGGRLLVAGVHDTPPLPFPRTFDRLMRELEDDLGAVRDELAPGAEVRIEVEPSAAHGLCRVVESEGADLLVVGSRHRRRMQRIAEGDRTMQVLHGARCAVLVVPDPVGPEPLLGRIGVGLQDTPEADAALDMARELAERAGAQLRLIAVADDSAPPWLAGASASSYAEMLDEIMAVRLQAARALLEAKLASVSRVGGVAVDGDVAVGDPVGELVLAGGDLDLLVLGSRRWGPLRRLALGSTSERVIRNAACPVLVPPRGIGSAADVAERDEDAELATP